MKKIRKLINLIIGIDGRRLITELEDIRWGQRFLSAQNGSSWLRGGVYAGGWAVNWSFLCILYRILDEIQPDSILELGLGQTTKLTTSYMKSKLGKHEKKHSIIEHDEEWMNFMKHSIDLSKSELMILALEENRYKEIGWMRYKDFSTNVKGNKYDLILIDGPFGSDKEISRTDVLDIIPECLQEAFIIMMDDSDRQGEQNTCSKICRILEEKSIPYVTAEYGGTKNVKIVASESRKFVCSMN